MAGLPQLTGGYIQILDGAKPSFFARFGGIGEYLGDQNVEQIESIIGCSRFHCYSEGYQSGEAALFRQTLNCACLC
jgi:hypothetical protein